MSRGFLSNMCWLCCLLAFTALSGCAGKHSGQDKAAIVLEPEAIDKGPALSDEEVACLKSTGEIDRNLPSTVFADVTRQYKYYLRAGRNHMQASVKRSEKYLPYVREVFGKRGLPKDLAYLAIVESGYRTDAKSHAGAVGAWQFVPKTGEHFGLHQDGFTDERMDIYEASEAAADYLKKLHARFRDWPTAIAAYNAGEGKMQRAMEGSGSHNFFEVRERNETLPYKLQLREETTQYVPRFLAVAKIMRNLKTLHFTTTGEKGVEVVRLNAKPATDLKTMSKALNITWGDFCKLNRHHKTGITSLSQQTYVYVPSDKVREGKEYLAHNAQGNYAGWRVCAISEGQSWKKLGHDYKISSDKLRAVNPGCSLKTGELVYLPANNRALNHDDSYAKQERYTAAKHENRVSKGNGKTHILRSNETLYAVARRYGVSPNELMQVNHITDPAHLPTGKVLQIPNYQHNSKSSHVASSEPAHGSSMGKLGTRKASVYVVQKSDSLWSIARRKNVTVDDLKRWNDVDERSLKTGTRLTVYAD